MKTKKQKAGFTLIELLVVIAIIGILSSIVIASLNQVRVKSREAKRKADINQIYTALMDYQLTYGGIPTTYSNTNPHGYVDANAGGWDYSSQGGFMTFLVTSGILKTVPVDPLNNMPGDGTPGTYAYKYYCYPGEGLALGYNSEVTGLTMWKPVYKESGWQCL